MDKSTRSNSDDNISLDPISKIIHSKPIFHGAGQMSFGTKDDSSTMLSSSEYIASSPYYNSSSAIAGFTKDQIQQMTTMSIVEQQLTIAHTKELSLPMDFLPGEEDVKLKEYITYHIHKQKVTYHGDLILTKYRLLFVTNSSESAQILVDVPLGMISQIVKVGGQTRSNISDNAVYGIEINCKDLRHFFFGNAKEQNQRRNLYDKLNRLIFPFSIRKADITNPQAFFSSFFAWNYRKAMCPDKIDDGWKLYNEIKEYTRMGIQSVGDAHWIINIEINKNYTFCDTYPHILVLPSNFATSRLDNVASFRSRNRIPVLSWYCRQTYATITRSSQPLTGLNRKCQDDMDYLHEIANTNVNEGSKLFIIDARPKVNALANKANGGGYEDYSDCDLEFQNIQNIHVMRESLNKLHSTIRQGSQEDKAWLNDLGNLNWLLHIRAILTSVNRLVSLVHNDKRSVLVHCSDGWDRTSQLTSLAMLMLDPYYRTLDGYMILIEKEWISFGHKFFFRIGHGDKIYSERSPVFLQFLDCTYQLLQQFESTFEFNEKFLLTIADYLYSCQYGTFLLNSEKIRTDMQISEYTMSVWTPMLHNRQTYLNSNYDTSFEQILQINTSNQIKLWKNYYFRYMPDYQSTLVN
ncbi:unnamed protein product [Rotaria sp. Silwood2]|nr:unnamed protein product [Rotaria sp. Silwood2]CAF2858040.1 unnamed protein product [Rotaria sp. Silwood2]CAF3002924.1 unnamed protein product [Rotaria sp. Silwood2]CAF3985357.1 unnamed protein product [Rotaria sp. Silwood2]CAF4054068.1 unnamed protein product [Rotaria sp. Silwood2]